MHNSTLEIARATMRYRNSIAEVERQFAVDIAREASICRICGRTVGPNTDMMESHAAEFAHSTCLSARNRM